MSRTYLFAVQANGDVEYYDETINAWQGAMHIWDTIIKAYHVPAQILFDMQVLWDVPETLSERDKWVLTATFDRVVVPREHLATYLEHLRSFTAQYPTDNLQHQIRLIQQLLADPAILGCCWNQTNVNGDPEMNWEVPTRERVDDDDDDIPYRPYNIHRDTHHWLVTPQTVTHPQE